MFVKPASPHEGVLLMPWWDERGPREAGTVVAPSLEALLARGASLASWP